MAAPSKGLVGIFKQGWHEIPEVIGSTFMALIGVGLGTIGLYNYYSRNLDNRRYKREYTVIRHDDPKVDTLRTDFFE